ncbi:killer cell lectin-like receptor subfamily G member 1 [Oryctolagus cuniculus]|uniref:C-type lectin domain-containing protein n=1 Tax=Oryctolagus cuniculus TaxID=9986 RepID=A0A5F9CCG2_RABIT
MSEGVTYLELKLPHSKKEKGQRHQARKRKANPCIVILGIICLFLLPAITGLGYMFFQRCCDCTMQDTGNTNGNNMTSVEAEEPSVSPPSTERHCGSCQRQWVCCGTNCYYFSKEEATWNESAKSCQDKKSHLVTINDKEEQNFIQTQTKYNYWIGLYRKGAKYDWMWQDGTVPAKDLAFQAGKVADKCGCLKSGYINSAACEKHFRYICEKDAPFLSD